MFLTTKPIQNQETNKHRIFPEKTRKNDFV